MLCAASATAASPGRSTLSRRTCPRPTSRSQRSKWRKCTVQTFFAEKQHIRYFVVEEGKGAKGNPAYPLVDGLDAGEQDFFRQLDEDAATAEEDAKAEANIAHGFNSHRSAVVS